jgi:asparagine synthase (glutamine-hydrolysing)
MCGIAGIVGRVTEVNRSALRRMSGAMTHRGPDADGVWESPASNGDGAGEPGIMLAHRRLAILDLSDAGRQPMIDPTTGDVVVFNGEIYNYRELRDGLAARGEQFQSSGDSVVMLRTLAVDGVDGVRRLRGMFAFAFWDVSRRELTLARDPLGIKPLYLARNPDANGEWSLAFASEVRALLASGLLPGKRLDPEAAASLVWNGFVVGPGTAVRGVRSLEPGRLEVFDAKGRPVRSHDFWTMPRRGRVTSDVDELAHVLEEGLRLHLASDVPLAVFLSGGVDSSAVANLARKAAGAPIHTFTLAFEEKQYDEGPDARRIAQAIGTQHHEVLLTESDFVGHLEAALDSLDQPTFDGLNSYTMSRAIRQAGFTVALVGTGGDELFGGYPTFRELPLLHTWSRRFAWVPQGAKVAAARAVAAVKQPSRNGFPPQTRWAKFPEMVRAGADLLALYQLAYALFLPDFERELLGGDGTRVLRAGLPAAMWARLRDEAEERSPLAAISVMEQRLFLGERLLRDNDAASMAASIEQRLPLVDQILLETVVGLDDDARFRPLQKKAILRRIGLRGLDPALFDRPKRGFVLPFDRWIRLGLGKAMDETMRDAAAVRAAGLDPEAVQRLWGAFQEGGPGLYWSRVWALYVLIRWCERHGVRA